MSVTVPRCRRAAIAPAAPAARRRRTRRYGVGRGASSRAQLGPARVRGATTAGCRPFEIASQRAPSLRRSWSRMGSWELVARGNRSSSARAIALSGTTELIISSPSNVGCRDVATDIEFGPCRRQAERVRCRPVGLLPRRAAGGLSGCRARETPSCRLKMRTHCSVPRAERLRRRRKATSPEPLEGSGERRNFLKCACCPPQGGWIVAEVKIS